MSIVVKRMMRSLKPGEPFPEAVCLASVERVEDAALEGHRVEDEPGYGGREDGRGGACEESIQREEG